MVSQRRLGHIWRFSMDRIDENYPQFIRIDSEQKEKYMLPLIDTPSSLLYKRDQGEVYFLAVGLGYKFGKRILSKKATDVRTYHGISPEFKTFVRTIVLGSENYNYDILKDGSRTLKLIEEYANGGISLLYDKIFNTGTNFSIEDEIWSEIKQLGNSTSNS